MRGKSRITYEEPDWMDQDRAVARAKDQLGVTALEEEIRGLKKDVDWLLKLVNYNLNHGSLVIGDVPKRKVVYHMLFDDPMVDEVERMTGVKLKPTLWPAPAGREMKEEPTPSPQTGSPKSPSDQPSEPEGGIDNP